MSTKVLICCGSGGVGKTTISAAMSIAQAMAGRRACVITIDPARRLAESLGFETLGNEPQPIDLSDLKCSGTLHGMMLDAHGTFDEVIQSYSKSPESAERLLANRYYQFASSRLGGSHEYMAMHKLLDLVESGNFDVVILDTPPTQQALEFLAAPDKMRGLMDQGVLRWLIMPATRGGWRALELGSELLAKALKKLIGKNTVSEIGEFFEAFQEHWEDFRTRSERVQSLLHSNQTQFILVTAPAPVARDEALGFVSILEREDLPFSGFIVNRVLAAPEHASPERAPSGTSGVQAAELQTAISRRVQRSHAHQGIIDSLKGATARSAGLWRVPDQGSDLHSTTGLSRLSAFLPQNLWETGD